MELRDYQQRAIDQLYDWFRAHPEGHPVINMPGGSGKSVVIAAIAKDALQSWPETRVLMLVHSKELIVQNAQKLRQMWPGAPLGIYSASVGKRQMGEPITYAGIGSIYRRISQIGHIDILIIDEVHLVNAKESGIYRQVIRQLMGINPRLRMVGFSASPYRLGHGFITDGDEAIFTHILEPVSIPELIYKKHLVPLRSKVTQTTLSTEGLHKRQGEYIAAEMEQQFNTLDNNTAIVQEIMQRAGDREHWLIFCAGVDHAKAMQEAFHEAGVSAGCVIGSFTKKEREQALEDFESGKTRAMCSVGVLTTGYDFPALDCIAFLRATASPGLYLQMAVRGMRPHPGKEDCLVLDFAGVVAQHGPITSIQIPAKGLSASGNAPTKTCPECGEIAPIAAIKCPACDAPFPPKEPKTYQIHDDDIMGPSGKDMVVTSWTWRKHISRSSGKEMLACTYYGMLSDLPVQEFYPVMHEGYAGEKAMRSLGVLAVSAGVSIGDWWFTKELENIAEKMNEGTPPSVIHYQMDGKFYRVITRSWDGNEKKTA